MTDAEPGASAPARRRRVVGLVVVAAAIVAVLVIASQSRSSPPRPDVLVLVMDTTRADRCSFLGYGKPTTPRLDEFAKQSIVYEDAWSPSSWTMPAHAALFTGRLPESLGIMKGDRDYLPQDVPTLASLLRDAGWATACITANGWIAKHSGLTRGFEHDDPLWTLGPRGTAAEAHARALTWMKKQRADGKRFFAFVNDIEPHAPWAPPEDVAKRFLDPSLPAAAIAEARALAPPRTTRVSLGAETLAPEVVRAASDLYDGDLAALDAEIGRLLDAMVEADLLRNTIVVIAGDHGEGLLQHGWLEHDVMVHRELLRVPLLVRLPRGRDPGRVAEPVEFQDVFPTILELCGVRAPDGLESRSLLTDKTPRVPRAVEVPRLSFMVGFRRVAPGSALEVADRTRRSVYDGRHHLVVDDKGNVELYDVREDPDEKTNLAAKAPDVVASLRAKLDAKGR